MQRRKTVFHCCSAAALYLLCQSCRPAYAQEASYVVASWYGSRFADRTMANGEIFDPGDPTIAAHRTLPFGTRLELTNPQNGRSLSVVVQDRGPDIPGRMLDLSRAAATALGYKEQGIAILTMQRIGYVAEGDETSIEK